jgi:hypothetical protein
VMTHGGLTHFEKFSQIADTVLALREDPNDSNSGSVTQCLEGIR